MNDIGGLLNQINTDVKGILSQKRYDHSIGVMKKAEELAREYHVDIDKARLVGLAHDIAKDMSKEEKQKYVIEHKIEIDEIEQNNVELLHSKIGADICKNKYHFSEDMKNAILYHTTGNPGMDDLAKIIFIADKTEEGRRYVDFARIEEIQSQGLDAILIYLLDESIKFTMNKRELIHPDSIETRNRILMSLSKKSIEK